MNDDAIEYDPPHVIAARSDLQNAARRFQNLVNRVYAKQHLPSATDAAELEREARWLAHCAAAYAQVTQVL
jgi:hypothetical protein